MCLRGRGQSSRIPSLRVNQKLKVVLLVYTGLLNQYYNVQQRTAFCENWGIFKLFEASFPLQLLVGLWSVELQGCDELLYLQDTGKLPG